MLFKNHLSKIVANRLRFGVTIVCSCTGLFSIYLIGRHFWINYARSRKGLPTGPTGVPIFGCMFSLLFYDISYLQYWGKKQPSLMSLRLGKNDVIVINSLKIYRTIHDNYPMFSQTRPKYHRQFIGWPTFQEESGESCMKRRQLCINSLLKQTNKQFMQQIYETNFKKMLTPILETKANENVWERPMDDVSFMAFSAIFKFVFDEHDLTLSDEKFVKFRKCLDNVSKQLKWYIISNALPPWVGSRMYDHELTVAQQNMYKPIVRDVILGRQKLFNESESKENMTTTVDYLLEEYRNNNITMEQLCGDCSSVIASAMSVSARLLHAMYCLAIYPEIYEKLYDDLTQIYPHKQFSFDESSKCHSLKAFIYESIRTCSALNIGHTRLVMQENGMKITDKNNKIWSIPKNTQIFINLTHIEYCDSHYRYPQSIYLKHFMNESETKFVMNRDFIGFGYGKRQCIAEPIAVKSMMVFLAIIILKGYKFELHKNDKNYSLLKLKPTNRHVPYNMKEKIKHVSLVVKKRNDE